MGIIKAAVNAVKGGLADQWLEVIEEADMGDDTVFCEGIKIRRGENVRGSDGTVTNGSVIHVYSNQCMLLVDGGKIIDYTAEEGYYKVDNTAMPSLFNGDLGAALEESFERIKFGGKTPQKQQVFFINLQEMKGLKFGTRNPVNYFDNFYNAELFLRAHGNYSIKIADPILFYKEAVPKNRSIVKMSDINEQYLSEFLEALQSAIGQMSVDGIRISHIQAKGRELGKYMAEILDEDWKKLRGIEIVSVGIASISYDENSQKLIHMRNEGAMLSDPTVREGYVQGSVARGMEAAGANPAGAGTAFMGMGVGMNMSGGFMSQASSNNMAQMQMQQAQKAAEPNGWTCQCGARNTGKFCSECGKPAPRAEWICQCGTKNTGKFCSECGKPAPQAEWICECGAKNTGKFCQECGKARSECL